MDFSQRLRLLIKKTGLKREEFAERAGKSRGQLFKYLGGESSPTAEFFQEIKQAFPWVNIEWLLTGTGEMISYEINEESDHDKYGRGSPRDPVTEKILLMLQDMPEEKRREILKYVEDQKLLADLLAERGDRRKVGGDSGE